MVSKTVKKKIVVDLQTHIKDTGSAQVQVGLVSRQIDELTKHLKHHPKDHHSRRGLLKMVSRRRKLMKYLSDKSPKEYEKVVKKLGLKK